MLYSYHGQQPAPLPFRILLSNGFTRTDPLTFTEDEIQDAGFTGPFSLPDYDPATETLSWDNNQYTVSPLPDPGPDWEQFRGLLVDGVSKNLQAAPPDNIANLLPAIESIAPGINVIDLAQECNLPEDFVQSIAG